MVIIGKDSEDSIVNGCSEVCFSSFHPGGDLRWKKLILAEYQKKGHRLYTSQHGYRFALEKEVLERMITTSFVRVVETPSDSANGSER